MLSPLPGNGRWKESQSPNPRRALRLFQKGDILKVPIFLEMGLELGQSPFRAEQAVIVEVFPFVGVTVSNSGFFVHLGRKGRQEPYYLAFHKHSHAGSSFPLQGKVGPIFFFMEASMTQVTQTVENGIIVFNINITRWSANKKLRIQHTKATAEELPPADLASLGVRKVFDPKALAPFEAIRKECERLCFNEGTSFFGGVAVSKSEAEGFAKKIKALQERFNVAKTSFSASYEESLKSWRDAHPGWEHTIEGALSADEALSRFNFTFHAVEIIMSGNVESAGKTELEQNIASSKGAFVGQLYAEIAQMAATYRKESLLGKEKATARGLSALQAMRKKLNGLGFLDSRIRPLVGMIDKVMAELPSSGSIDGAQFATLMGVTSILSDQDLMQQYGDQVNEGVDANSLFYSLTTPKAETAASAVVQPTVPTVATMATPGIPQFKPAIPNVPKAPGVIPPPMATGWGVIPSRVAISV